MKKRRKITGLIFIVPFIILIILNLRCNRQTETRELDQETFVRVYCDVVTYGELVQPDRKAALVDSILNSYHISREQFQQTVASYSQDEEKWEKIFVKIVEELEAREKQLTAEADSVTTKNGNKSNEENKWKN